MRRRSKASGKLEKQRSGGENQRIRGPGPRRREAVWERNGGD
ncbi:hypothetical protein HMPREF1986_01509 [Oribacterium sp. oral taxon 078 str. F0263]|nr:hypothetical protein HMPREF1986_01509 [Oribacterium sp. oral taxon 078 str. F0263]